MTELFDSAYALGVKAGLLRAGIMLSEMATAALNEGRHDAWVLLVHASLEMTAEHDRCTKESALKAHIPTWSQS